MISTFRRTGPTSSRLRRSRQAARSFGGIPPCRALCVARGSLDPSRFEHNVARFYLYLTAQVIDADGSGTLRVSELVQGEQRDVSYSESAGDSYRLLYI